MISPLEEEDIRQQAYLPEHVLPLMTGISGADPSLDQGHLFFLKDDWAILVGYPLAGEFQEEVFLAVLARLQREFRPAVTWFVAPDIPASLLPRVRGKEADEYYTLDLQGPGVKRRLLREVEKAARVLRVERGRQWSPEHEALTREFLAKEDLPPRVRELYLRIPQVLDHSPTSLILSARDAGGNLCAFFAVELGAQRFATYVVGCYSLTHYVPHASDLLFSEMIGLARESGKEYIHLGLGVNEGIRRFKIKWGGAAGLPYFAGEIGRWQTTALSWLRSLASRI